MGSSVCGNNVSLQTDVHWVSTPLVSADTGTDSSHPRADGTRLSRWQTRSWYYQDLLTGSFLIYIQYIFNLCTVVKIYNVIAYINIPCSTNLESDHMLLHKAEFLHSCIFFNFQDSTKLLFSTQTKPVMNPFLHTICISTACLKLKPKVEIIRSLIYY